MPNPWSTIPLRDYEDHMQSEAVGQLAVLAHLFEDVLRKVHPASLAILGVAGGNGLNAIESRITHRICAIDLNPAYLEAVRERYPHLPGLELHCADLALDTLNLLPVELVHAALIFEHAGVRQALTNAAHLVAPNGYLSIVLQLPSTEEPAVGSTSPATIQTLRQPFRFVDPAQLSETLTAQGFHQINHSEHPLPSGKRFCSGLFQLQQ